MEEKDDLLSAEDILGTDDIEYVKVPAWGGKSLQLQSLTAGDMIEFVQTNEGPARHTAGVRLIIKSAVDKDKKRMFKDSDLELLKRKNSKITNVIVDAILKLNGLDKKSQEAAKNVSGEAVPADSPSVLH
jgi:hypothetical protein